MHQEGPEDYQEGNLSRCMLSHVLSPDPLLSAIYSQSTLTYILSVYLIGASVIVNGVLFSSKSQVLLF